MKLLKLLPRKDRNHRTFQMDEVYYLTFAVFFFSLLFWLEKKKRVRTYARWYHPFFALNPNLLSNYLFIYAACIMMESSSRKQPRCYLFLILDVTVFFRKLVIQSGNIGIMLWNHTLSIDKCLKVIFSFGLRFRLQIIGLYKVNLLLLERLKMIKLFYIVPYILSVNFSFSFSVGYYVTIATTSLVVLKLYDSLMLK